MNKQELAILIPILVPIATFAMVFGIVYLNSREKMAMIERGMNPKEFRRPRSPFAYLKWALLLTGAGLGMFLANILNQTLLAKLDGDNWTTYFAFIALFGGLGLFVSYLIEKRETIDKPKEIE